MEGNDQNSAKPNAAGRLRSSELSGWLRVQIFAATMAVAVAAFGAVILFAVHMLAFPPGSLPVTGTMPAMMVPVILLFHRYMNPIRDHPFTRRCFLLECLAVFMATISSNVAAIWILRPWLAGQSDYLVLLGLGGIALLVVYFAATAAQVIVLRVCAKGIDSTERLCG